MTSGQHSALRKLEGRMVHVPISDVVEVWEAQPARSAA